MSKWDRRELLDALLDRKVPSGGVNDMAAAFDAPEAREVVVTRPATENELAKKDHLQQFGGNQPVGLRQAVWKGAGNEGLDAAGRTFSAPPHYGEHTEEILRNVLGKDDAEAARLVKLFHGE
ncbi:Hypothetical Protein FCC1311_004681 [Hondaea fermentalgiana]|uniref:Uncharacterized protein n=1 Tax=Hondaea fermentalgiana TaxID=2315210 RepID=A0A2R5GCV1_9STRA|nr:Hypothetical Protein FCC1311_004681 [Hondaea fermentalgiana]|eukprot:GBG26001.1 Hypothetical Protein FCC1311_004681 [Hondaea fermentalgiana]